MALYDITVIYIVLALWYYKKLACAGVLKPIPKFFSIFFCMHIDIRWAPCEMMRNITSRTTINFIITSKQLSPSFLNETDPNLRLLTSGKSQGSIFFNWEIVIYNNCSFVAIDVEENKVYSSLVNFTVVEQCFYLFRVWRHGSQSAK